MSAAPHPSLRVDLDAGRLALFCGVSLLACAALGALAVSTTASAQDSSLPDPTRPPASILQGPKDEAQVVVAAGPVLQSVIIAEGRRGAIISGQYVALGGRYGDARLTQVSESSVVLRGAAGAQTLMLFPAVEILHRPKRDVLPAGAAGGKPAANGVRREGKVVP